MVMKVYGLTQKQHGFSLLFQSTSHPPTHMQAHTGKKEQLGELTLQLNRKSLT